MLNFACKVFLAEERIVHLRFLCSGKLMLTCGDGLGLAIFWLYIMGTRNVYNSNEETVMTKLSMLDRRTLPDIITKRHSCLPLWRREETLPVGDLKLGHNNDCSNRAELFQSQPPPSIIFPIFITLPASILIKPRKWQTTCHYNYNPLQSTCNRS